MNSDGIKQKMIRSSFWTSLESAALEMLSLVVFLVLARLLQPDDYGLIAISMAFVAVLGAISGFGISGAMVQSQELEKIHLSSGFWFSLITGVLLYLIIYAGAPHLAALYDEPELHSVLLCLGLIGVIEALETVPRALLNRHFQFRYLAFRSIMSNIVAGVIGITMAVNGYGVWALVAQQLSMAIARTILTWVGAQWFPTLHISWPTLKRLLSVGGYIMGSSLSNTLNRQVDNLLIGTFLGTRALGVYSIGFKAFESANGVLLHSISRLGLPTFSRLQDAPHRLANAYRQVWTMGAALTLPVLILIMLTAQDLVPYVFGRQWQGSAIILQFLMIASCCRALTNFDPSLLIAYGRSKLAFRLALLKTGLNIVGCVVAVKWGINAVAAALAIVALIMLPVSKLTIRSHLPISPIRSWSRLVAIGFGLVTLSGAALLARFMLSEVPTLLLISMQWFLGLLVYVFAVYILDRTMRNGLKDLIKLISGKL